MDNSADCDDNDSSITDGFVFYRDSDTDTYGDPSSSMKACSVPDGYVEDNTDCDDTNFDIKDA